MKWRLVTDYDIIYQKSRNQVFLIPVEKRKNSKFISYLEIEGNYVKLESGNIENFSPDEVEAKFNKSMGLEIKLGDFWATLGNPIEKSNLGNLLTECTIQNSVIQGKFEVAFSDDDYCTEIKLISPGMTDYDECFDEMTRITNCRSFKKTKKFIPGHRYDSESETIYYLGSFFSRKVNSYCSNFGDKPEKIHLYTNKLPKEAKSISDVLKLGVIGIEAEEIQYKENIPGMVDSGKVLEDDSPNIEDYWEVLMTNAITSSKQPYGSSSRIRYQFFYKALEPFILTNSDQKVNIPEKLKNTLETSIGEMIDELLIIYYNSDNIFSSRGLFISESIPQEEVRKNVFKLFCKYIMDPNALSYSYYEEFFNYASIDFQEILSKSLKNYDKDFITSSFDNFMTWWKPYFRYHSCETSAKKSCQRTVAVRPFGRGKVNAVAAKNTINSLFGNTALAATLTKLVDVARNGDPTIVSKYQVVNIGTRTKPKEYIDLTVNVDDVVEFAKKTNSLTEDLKEDILKYRFTELNLDFDIHAQQIK